VIATLADGAFEPGVHEVQWQGRVAAPGLYFVRYTVPGRTLTRRLVRME